MIQRIQSLYLSLSVVILAGSAIFLSDTYARLREKVADVSNVWFLFLVLGFALIASMVAVVVCLFSYKKRARQLRLIRYTTLFLLGYYMIYGVTVWELSAVSAHCLSAKDALPAFVVLFTYLAKQRIRRDEELVRAADRIR